MNKYIIGTLTILLIATGYLYYNATSEADDINQDDILKYVEKTSTWGDFNRDGVDELAVKYAPTYYWDDQGLIEEKLVIYSHDGEEIASFVSDSIAQYSDLPDSLSAVSFSGDGYYDVLKISKLSGGHTVESLFFRLVSDTIVPICKGPDTTTGDCFFVSNRGDVAIEDIDDDGIKELIEYVDEYPETGGRGEAIVAATYKFKGDHFEIQ